MCRNNHDLFFNLTDKVTESSMHAHLEIKGVTNFSALERHKSTSSGHW